MAAIAAGSLALNVISGASSGKANQDSASIKSDAAAEGIVSARNALKKLQESSSFAREGITVAFNKRLKDFSESFGFKKGNLREQIDQRKSNTGFANTSTGAKELEMVNKSIESGMEDMEMEMGSKMGEIDANEKAERTRLESQVASLEMEKKLADKTSEGWYLGKNLMNFLD